MTDNRIEELEGRIEALETKLNELLTDHEELDLLVDNMRLAMMVNSANMPYMAFLLRSSAQYNGPGETCTVCNCAIRKGDEVHKLWIFNKGQGPLKDADWFPVHQDCVTGLWRAHLAREKEAWEDQRD